MDIHVHGGLAGHGLAGRTAAARAASRAGVRVHSIACSQGETVRWSGVGGEEAQGGGRGGEPVRNSSLPEKKGPACIQKEAPVFPSTPFSSENESTSSLATMRIQIHRSMGRVEPLLLYGEISYVAFAL